MKRTRTKNRSVAVDDQDKKIAEILHIPYKENKEGYSLFSSAEGEEFIFNNKKHSVLGDILYIVELDNKVKLKEIVFVDSILNLICLLRSKKYEVKSNSVFVVSNNPNTSVSLVLRSRFDLVYKYIFAYSKTIQGKIQSLKTMLFLSDFQNVRVNVSDKFLIVDIDEKQKRVRTDVSIQRLIRDFNFSKQNFHFLSLGYNVYNLKYLYGYKD